VEISGIPEGATLTADGEAVTVTDGTATLTPEQLDSLVITPPANSSDDFQLTVTATSTDGSDTATTTGTIDVSVAAVADAPTLSVSDAMGVEDQDGGIALDISAATTDTGETLSVEISGIPDGSTLTAGGVAVAISGGVALLTASQLDDLVLAPPANASGDFSLTVTATSTDGTDTATTTGVMTVSVDPQADSPSLTVADASGAEDSAIELDISAALTDSGETLSVEISGIPTGATLKSGDTVIEIDGDTATLTPSQLETLTITPPANASGEFTLSVTAVSTDGDSQATTVGTIVVDVEAVADAPTITTTLGDAVTETTGGMVTPTTISADSVTDTGSGFTVTAKSIVDGALSEASADNIATNSSPAGFGVAGSASGADSEIGYDDDSGLSEELHVAFDTDVTTADVSFVWLDGTETATYTLYRDGVEVGSGTAASGDPTVTLTADGGAAFDQIVFTAPSGGDHDYLIESIDFDAVTGGTTTVSFPLTITAETDDNTDGSESVSVQLSDIPDDAILSSNGVAITVTNGAATLTADQLANLTLTVPEGHPDFDLIVTATSSDGASTAETTETITVDVPSVAGDTITGTDGADDLTGTAGDDVIRDNPEGSDTSGSGDDGGTSVGSGVNAVFHFALEDTTWGNNETVTDSVNGVTGTARGGTGTASGAEGNAAQFDGSGDYIEVPHDAAMELDAGTFTIDFVAWNNGTIASKDSSGYDDGGHFDLSINSSREVELRIQTDDDESFYLRGGDLDWSNWHNATVTWDGDTVTLYVNGEAVDSVESDYTMANNEEPWTFGASQQASGDGQANSLRDYFDGKIDNPALLDGALDGTEVAAMNSQGVADYVENSLGGSSGGGGDSGGSGATEQVTLLSEDFTSGSGAFTYSDGAVADSASSSTSGYESGSHGSHGESGNGLSVTLGGIDGDDIADLSGGWTTTISVTEQTQDTSLTFSYRMVYPANAESDEAGEVRVALNGELVDVNGNDYVARLVGDGDSGIGTQDTGWQTVTIDLGDLEPGDHTITLGGWFEEKTASDEELTIYFDNVSVTGNQAVSSDDDTIDAGYGDDVIYSDAGNDVIDAGAGTDTVVLTRASGPSPISRWNFDETSGSTVADSVGDNDGTVVGDTILDFSGANGSGASFDGSNDYVEVPHDSSMELAEGSLTLSFNASTQQNTLLSKGTNGEEPGEFRISTRNDGSIRLQFTDQNGDSKTLEGGDIDWNEWNDVTMTFGSEGLHLYLNGELVASDTDITNGIDGNTEEMKFAVKEDNGDDYSGGIDDVALYDQQLSADQVSTLSNDGIDGLSGAGGTDETTTVDAGDGDDMVIAGGAADTLDGGDGEDTVSYENSEEAVTIDFSNGTVSGGDAEGDSLVNFENITGSAYDDTLRGDAGANTLDGGGGSDELTGGGGADVFKLGQDGIDTIVDFNAAEGDKIDVSSLIDVGGVDNIDNYLRLEEDPDTGNTTVKVNTAGDGDEAHFEDVATLEGVTGLDIGAIIQDENNGGEV
jgi:Ca2+-binding RTX toxin-like protein